MVKTLRSKHITQRMKNMLIILVCFLISLSIAMPSVQAADEYTYTINSQSDWDEFVSSGLKGMDTKVTVDVTCDLDLGEAVLADSICHLVFNFHDYNVTGTSLEVTSMGLDILNAQMSDITITMHNTDTTGSAGIISSELEDCPITIDSLPLAAFVVQDSKFINSNILTSADRTAGGVGSSIFEDSYFNDSLITIFSTNASFSTGHSVTGCHFAGESGIRNWSNGNTAVYDISECDFEGNTSAGIQVGNAVVNLKDITATDCRANFIDDSSGSTMGSGIYYAKIEGLTLSTNQSGLTGIVGKYGSFALGHVSDVHISGFDTGLDLGYLSLPSSIIAFAGDDILSPGDVWQVSDVTITDCIKGLYFDTPSTAFDKVFGNFSDIHITGREGAVSNSSSCGLSIRYATAGSDNVITSTNHVVFSDVIISNVYQGINGFSGKNFVIQDSEIKDVVMGVDTTSGSILLQNDVITAIEDAGDASKGVYVTSSSSGTYLVDTDVAGFHDGMYVHSGAPNIAYNCTFDNLYSNVSVYAADIVNCVLKNAQRSVEHYSSPNYINGCIIEGDGEETIGIYANSNALLGINKPDSSISAVNGRANQNSSQLNVILSLSKRDLTGGKSEIKNCKIGIQKGQVYVADLWVHDCDIGIDNEGTAWYTYGGNVIEDCEIGQKAYRYDIGSYSQNGYKKDIYRHCGVGLTYSDNQTIFMTGSIGGGNLSNPVATLFEDNEIGLKSNGNCSGLNFDFVNNRTGWVIEDCVEMQYNGNIHLSGNDIGIDKQTSKNYQVYCLVVDDEEEAVDINTLYCVYASYTGKNVDYNVKDKDSQLVFSTGSITADSITFDTPVYQRGQVVCQFVSYPNDVVAVYAKKDGWVTKILNPGDYSITGKYYGDPDISGPSVQRGSYFAVLFPGAKITYDYKTNGGEDATWTGGRFNVVQYEEDEEVDVSQYSASKEGYRFLGWSTDPDDESKIIEDPWVAGTTNRTVYAMFEKIVKVTYDYETNGGTSMTPSSAEYETKPGEKVNLSYIAAKKGYDFVGWNTNADAHEGLTELVIEEDDITLYAIYKKDYTVRYHTYDSDLDYTDTVSVYNNEAFAGTYAEYGVANGEYTFAGYSLSKTVGIPIIAGAEMQSFVSDVYCLYRFTTTLTYKDYDKSTTITTDTGETLWVADDVTKATNSFTVKGYTKKKGFKFKNWTDGASNYEAESNYTTSFATATLIAIGDVITTEAPDIAISKHYIVTLTAGNIENDTLDKIMYRINGGEWTEYIEPFAVYKKFKVEAYQITKDEQIESDKSEKSGYEMPTGIDAEYTGDDKELLEKVPKDEVTVTVHYPNSGDEILIEDDFELEDDIILKEGTNEVTVKHKPYPDAPDCPEFTDTVEVNGITPTSPAKTDKPIITVSQDCKVTLAAGPIVNDVLDMIYYRVNDGEWVEYDNQPFPVYKKYKVDAYQTTQLQKLTSDITTVSGIEYPTGITAEYVGDDKPVGDEVDKDEVIVTVHYPNSPDETTTDFTLTDTIITHEGLNDVGVEYTEYPGDPNCPDLKTTVGVNGIDDNPEIGPPIKVETDPPTITVSSDAKVTLTPGAILNDTLGNIYYRVNGGDWHVYHDIFPVYKIYKVEAYQVTKEQKVQSVIVEKTGRERPIGITAEYDGDYKEVGDNVDKDEVTVTVHWPNSPDETVTDFDLPDPIVHHEGSNEIGVTYNPYPDDDSSNMRTTVDVIGVKTPEPVITEQPTTEPLTTQYTTTESFIQETTTEVTTIDDTNETTTEEGITEETGMSSIVKTGDEFKPLVVVILLGIAILGLLTVLIIKRNNK